MIQNDLAVKISLGKDKFVASEEIVLQFKVQNNSEKQLKFCKIQTPCEGFRGIYLRIVQIESKEELPYYGPMVKRMPPQPDDYENLSKKRNTKCSVILNKAYRFEKKGEYSVQFIGQNMNNLPDSNILTFEIQ